MLKLINGMFAFCIVDLGKKRLYLARDHAGIKPLFWYKDSNTFLFSSEMKAFYNHPDFVAELNENVLNETFLHGYSCGTQTLLKNVQRILPGHYMEISEEDIKVHKYWEPSLETSFQGDEGEAALELETRLKKAVKSQLLSGVPLGCQLSGGVDSSLVSAFAAPYLGAKFKSYSVLPENKEFSEETYIDWVINNLQNDARKITLSAEEWCKSVKDATYYLEYPMRIAHAIPVMKMAQTATNEVKVLLSGEGADELMGGYEQFYRFAFRQDHLKLLNIYSKIPFRGKKYEKYFRPHLENKDFFIKSRSFAQDKGILYSQTDEGQKDTILPKLFPAYGEDLKKVRRYDMQGWLTHLLDIQDRMMMSASVEDRVPFLDKELIEFVFTLPSKYFVKSSPWLWNYKKPQKRTKILLKKIGKKYFGKKFVYRPKMGFNQPFLDYIQTNYMHELINDQLLPGIKARGLLEYNNVKKMCGRIRIGKGTSGYLVWSALCFEIWAQQFLDRDFVTSGFKLD
jgi:asparagine synthase (glutamine-hydrolysing)